MNKLDEDKIGEIRGFFAAGLSVRKTAAKTGADKNTVNTYFKEFKRAREPSSQAKLRRGSSRHMSFTFKSCQKYKGMFLERLAEAAASGNQNEIDTWNEAIVAVEEIIDGLQGWGSAQGNRRKIWPGNAEHMAMMRARRYQPKQDCS